MKTLIYLSSSMFFFAFINNAHSNAFFECLVGLDRIGVSPANARLWSTQSDILSDASNNDYAVWSNPTNGNLIIATHKFNYECNTGKPSSAKNLRLELPGSGLTDQFLVYKFGNKTSSISKAEKNSVKIDQEVQCTRTSDLQEQIAMDQLNLHANYFLKDDEKTSDNRIIVNGKSILSNMLAEHPEPRKLRKKLRRTLKDCEDAAGELAHNNEIAKSTIQTLRREVFFNDDDGENTNDKKNAKRHKAR